GIPSDRGAGQPLGPLPGRLPPRSRAALSTRLPPRHGFRAYGSPSRLAGGHESGRCYLRRRFARAVPVPRARWTARDRPPERRRHLARLHRAALRLETPGNILSLARSQRGTCFLRREEHRGAEDRVALSQAPFPAGEGVRAMRSYLVARESFHSLRRRRAGTD